MWEKDQSSFNIKFDRGRNPLHYTASSDYHDGVTQMCKSSICLVNFLLNKFSAFAYQRDNHGFFPIHSASRKGHVSIVQLILKLCLDSRDLLTPQGNNILHVAAKSGKTKALSCMLKIVELKHLVNEKDDDGKTLLHVATLYGHPMIVITLTEDERVRLETRNNVGLTAHDIAEECMETMASLRKLFTLMTLRVTGAPRAKVLKRKSLIRGEKQPKAENYRDKVNVVLLVATIIATVTFTAGLTIPGGYNSSSPDQGMATMLEKVKFQEFIICDTISMYCSLIWAQLGDGNSLHVVLKFALPILGIALAMMSISFMAGVYLVVSKFGWLAHVVLLMGLNFIILLLGLYFPFCFLGSSKYYLFRMFSYYPFRLMLYAFGRYVAEDSGTFPG